MWDEIMTLSLIKLVDIAWHERFVMIVLLHRPCLCYFEDEKCLLNCTKNVALCVIER